MSAKVDEILPIKHIGGVKRPQIFFSPLATLLHLIQSVAGSSKFGGSTEISSVSCMVPCNDKFQFNEQTINNPLVPLTLSPAYPHLYVITTIFPEDQIGSAATTWYDRSKTGEQMARDWGHVYPFLEKEYNGNGRLNMLWTHTHPGAYGTSPSGTDYNTFNDRIGLPIFGMLIINEVFATPGFRQQEHCSYKMNVRNGGIATNGEFVAGNGLSRTEYTNLKAIQAIDLHNFHIHSIYATFPDIFDDLVNNRYPEGGWEVNIDDQLVVIPSPKTVKSIVNKAEPPVKTEKPAAGGVKMRISIPKNEGEAQEQEEREMERANRVKRNWRNDYE